MKTPAQALASRPRWLSRGLRLGVLIAVLLGTLLSTMGALQAHALAPLEALQQVQGEHGDAHGHAHVDDHRAIAAEGGLHTHLGSDHSHDKAHALPVMPSLGPLAAPLGKPTVLAWADRLMVHRLERPPRSI
jgi:hypothetical protein